MNMKHSLTIALAISLVLGAAAAWGSCAVPRSGDRALVILDGRQPG
jgi:hypothetical protein